MIEDYMWLTLSIIIVIIGFYNFLKPKGFINKDTPKYHPIFLIEMKKYYRIRGPIMIILGLIMALISILNIIGKN